MIKIKSSMGQPSPRAGSSAKPTSFEAYRRTHPQSRSPASRFPPPGPDRPEDGSLESVASRSMPISLDVHRNRQRLADNEAQEVPIYLWLGSVLMICLLIALLFVV